MNAAELFLEGARARTLCLAVAGQLDDEIDPLLRRVEPEGGPAFARLDRVRPDAAGVARVVERLRRGAGSWSRSFLDPMALFPALEVAVDSAMPWQPPFMRDAVTAIPEVQAALVPMAELILGSPAAQWWAEGAARSEQWATSFVRAGEPLALASPGTAAGRLHEWRRLAALEEDEAQADGDVSVPFEEAPHGHWWSTPTAFGWERGAGVWATAPWSTRRLAGLGSAALALGEDGSGDSLANLHRVTPADDARVYEVHSKQDWADLVARYPFRARWSRRAVWGESTGLDADWHMPDFAAAAQDHDAIHLSVAGYLSAAGEAIALPGARATVIAGWAPDATYWLTDAASVDPAAETWECFGDSMHDWRLVGRGA